jgi:long-chain-acyl-CoA dehydrogenase
LFFNDVRVPMTNCLGEEGHGFIYLMSELPQERLSIAVSAQASAQKAFDLTVDFVKERKAFGKPVFNFQNTRFVLADMKTKLQVGWAHLDWAMNRHYEKKLTNEEGAAAKLWHTDLQWEIMDACLQLHGGAGYMNEYPIAKAWRAARVTRIFGGTNEIMKELIGRSL